MTLQELFDMQQAMQKESEKQGQHLPMYTKRKPVNGEKPSPENMHEEATRNQLSHLYKQQSQTPEDAAPAEQPPEDERLAQNLPQQGANAAGTLRDGAKLYSQAKRQQNSELYNIGFAFGRDGASEIYLEQNHGDNPEIWRGYRDGLRALDDHNKKKK